MGPPHRYVAARHRHELVERIYDAVSRFVMIDKDILRQALLASPRDLGEEAPAEILHHQPGSPRLFAAFGTYGTVVITSSAA
jgi:hypothetical protein